MTTARLGILSAGVLATSLAIAAPADAQIYSLGTGKQGFFTYSAGAALAKVAGDGGLNLRVQPFGGSSAYVPGVNAGEQQFGLANELETHYAVTGEVIYKGKPQPDLRVVALLTPLYSEFFVRKDSPIKTIADLKGKRVPSDYASQRVLDVLTKGTLANAGLSYDDVQKVPVPNVNGGADEFAKGNADVFMFALGSGKVAEVDAQVGGVRVLPVDHSKEAMERLRKFIPVAYATQVSPGKGRAGIDEPTWVYAYDYLVLVNDKVPDDVVYKLAKLMHDHKAELAANFGALSGFDPKRMAKEMSPVQFHPGAIKFYKEIGQWPPKGGS
ncbi:MAG TPA: TAXI family TRAP transporter solute-binding subunit [Pseudolabrys sp.]|nr:TAXI family TRAP transporter solute-binding subunit [Pseudolabrys sp.]